MKEGDDSHRCHESSMWIIREKQYPIASLPENLMDILRAGGLVKAMRKLNGLD